MNYLKTPILLAAVLFISTQAQAQNWYNSIDVKAFTSASYGFNFNNPESSQNDFRIFDTDANSIKLDVFELSLMKNAAKKGEAGFRVDFAAGSSIPRVIHSSGAFENQDVDLKQAYVTYIAPIGNGLQIDFGKFVTHIGYEVIDGNDGYNDNATRSFCFGYTIPFAHTGLRASYAFSDHVNAMLMVVNGWDNAVDNNKSKSLGAQIAVSPVDALNLFANFIYGPEMDNDNSNNTNVINIIGSYSLTDALSIGANVVLGSTDGVIEPEGGGDLEAASWTGLSGYLRYDFNSWFSLAFRGEQVDDADGFRTGTVQKLSSMTLTPEFRADDSFVFRFDMRMDSSDKEVFHMEVDDDGKSITDGQMTLTLNMIYILP
jgi:putative OmpL-like beta-barrel porin-2